LDNVDTADRTSPIIVFEVDVVRNVKDALHLDNDKDCRVVDSRKADMINEVGVAKGGDIVHDVLTAPMLQREVFDGQGHKRLVLEEETVCGFIHPLQRDRVANVDKGGMVQGGLTGIHIVKDNKLGTER